MNKERCLFVVSGPSGAGKDTVVQKLLALYPEVEKSISATSRAMREGEQEGVNYYYVTREEFEKRIKEHTVLEYTQYCGNYYGTLKAQVDARMEEGKTLVLVIEVEGAGNIKRIYPESTTIFVCPPSMQELENRLRGRGTEKEEVIAQRLQRAEEELLLATEYDFTVINDDVETCAKEIYGIICKRRKK